ncbi:uncharacterized protein BDV14DRAFT_195372 [Aspergillus stella-maris]|uniref:uncharacterized protein n=1 Tax=Aspergillus stella-maris TaxID=1810926 RepID=UPI003CCCCFDF
MDWLFGRRPVQAPVPGDRVLPLHFFENSLLVQGNNMAVSLVFNEVLDANKLRDSLEGLVKRAGWERLGGRLRRNLTTGKIEWHIPSEFTPDRPAISFAHVNHDIPSSSHSAASKIPSPSTQVPTVVGDPDALEEIAWEPGYKPGGINDYLQPDKDTPVLGLRVNNFTDRTIVTLQWQHVAFDALGLQYVVEGWNAMLWGKDDEIPTPCGTDEDPFRIFETGSREATEEHILKNRQIGWGGLLKWGLGYGVDMLLRAKENRMVCIPEAFWKGQISKALDGLRADAIQRGQDPSKVFLTENDIITASILRWTVLEMAPHPDRTVAASIAMSLRKSFEGDLISPSSEQPYVGNAFGWANVLLPAREITDSPLSTVARQIRAAINEQGTRAQHEAYYKLVRESGTGLPIVLFGDGGMAQVGFSNWAKAGLFDLDFGPARVSSNQDVAGESCRPCYVQENHGPVKPADGFFILGKDGGGNYWASACKVKRQWGRFEEVLKRDLE